MEKVYPPRTAAHTHTIIFLHGRDSTASDFASEFFESQASDARTLPQIFPSTKWVFPAAEVLISRRFRCEISQWFDMGPHEREDDQEISASVSRICDVVAREAAIVGAENLVLGGISQGFVVAVHALLRGEWRLGGLVGLCSWAVKTENLRPFGNGSAVKTPVFLSHARNDEIIGISLGEELRVVLSALGLDVCWRSYVNGGHWINEPQGVDDIVDFLEKIGVKQD